MFFRLPMPWTVSRSGGSSGAPRATRCPGKRGTTVRRRPGPGHRRTGGSPVRGRRAGTPHRWPLPAAAERRRRSAPRRRCAPGRYGSAPRPGRRDMRSPDQVGPTSPQPIQGTRRTNAIPPVCPGRPRSSIGRVGLASPDARPLTGSPRPVRQLRPGRRCWCWCRTTVSASPRRYGRPDRRRSAPRPSVPRWRVGARPTRRDTARAVPRVRPVGGGAAPGRRAPRFGYRPSSPRSRRWVRPLDR